MLTPLSCCSPHNLAARLQAFAEHIKFCANKLQLGVNFMPNTPSYERVVEMQVSESPVQLLAAAGTTQGSNVMKNMLPLGLLSRRSAHACCIGN